MLQANNKALYLVMAERILDNIISGTLTPESRLPSIREYAAEMQVNANTVVRTYDYLSSIDVIYNRRGVGFFVTQNALEEAIKIRQENVIGKELNEIFRQLKLLGIDPESLKERYIHYLANSQENI